MKNMSKMLTNADRVEHKRIGFLGFVDSRRERALVTNKLKPKEDENFQIGEVVISTRLVMRVRSYHWLLCHSLAQSLLSYFRNQRHGNGGRGWGGMR
ncbi:hypothetical protein L1987_56357 [Smallanthus sonchifolius]|uniref:Uncharacterized protein n=3 Tax=Smallanthus sonchifolius TaxID=185202 RepID=A0ACB9EDK8_9ASTR|nr:hypothetical protein L1987_84654 [Smallanthus sonchifolius]KAI3754994.1 hypothetical protein L1987_54786 [Smallanthus sonchifolius]KAI3756536.1 hypothetical protein L1987_56357 [Smallanthus sonchifolius]